MKYLVKFIDSYNRSTNKKKSSYELIVCDSYDPDISGMLTLHNCLVVDGVSYQDNDFKFRHSMFYWPFPKTVKYNYFEANIIVNREDIDNIKSIEDDQVFTYISKLNKEEATIEAQRLETESKLKYEEDKKKYEEKLEAEKNKSKNESQDDSRNILTKIKNYIEDLLRERC